MGAFTGALRGRGMKFYSMMPPCCTYETAKNKSIMKGKNSKPKWLYYYSHLVMKKYSFIHGVMYMYICNRVWGYFFFHFLMLHVLCVFFQALKLIKTSEFMPYIVFIAAGPVEIMRNMHELARQRGRTERTKTVGRKFFPKDIII